MPLDPMPFVPLGALPMAKGQKQKPDQNLRLFACKAGSYKNNRSTVGACLAGESFDFDFQPYSTRLGWRFGAGMPRKARSTERTSAAKSPVGTSPSQYQSMNRRVSLS